MKTKLLLIALAFGLMSGTCSNDDTPADPINECNCDKVYYDYGVTGFATGGVQPIWGYTEVAREPATNLDCADDTGNYVQLDSNSYYRIECE